MAKKKNDSIPSKALDALMSGKKLSVANRKELRELGESAIDGFMVAIGFDPARLTDDNGWRHLRLESAEGIAGITESEDELYLHVEAVVMPLPSDKDLIQPLMREALELNCTLPGACSLGIRGTRLVASATENMRGLHSPQEYGNLVHLVMALANTIDDGMKQKYGGTTRSRKKLASPQPVLQ
jgi:hypothetical protein